MGSKSSLTLKELASKLDLQVKGDDSTMISGVNDLKSASSTEVSFLHNKNYTSALKNSQAAAICIQEDSLQYPGQTYIICESPTLTFAKICNLLLENHQKSGFTDIHPTACIHPSATIAKNATIGPYAVIDRDVTVKSNAHIHSHTYIGPKSTIGENSLIHAGVIIREDCHIGKDCILQPSCVIGGCGYGYDTCKKTGIHTKLEHLGSVIIEDDVEIGACTTIDRGKFSKTIIRKGTKIDNQCMIAHNCDIGEANLIISMSGLAGSVKTGRNVIIAAQSGLVGHIEIADNVTLGARSAPIKSLKKPGVYIGAPAQEFKKELAEKISIRKLPEVLKKLKSFEKQFLGSDV